MSVVVSEGARTGGQVVRVNGPLVEIEGLSSVAALDIVEVGDRRLPAEVVAINEGTLTAEVFEYTGGLRVGDPVAGRGQPLSARLGPHLLGSIFDGLLRPLADRPIWLTAGSLEHRRAPTRWTFEPARVRIGTEVTAGTRLGSVAVGNLEHRVLVPPGAAAPLRWLAGPGEVDEEEPIATVGDMPVTLVEEWPVRRAAARSRSAAVVRATREWPAGHRPALPYRPWGDGRSAGGVRHRQDSPTPADRQVV